MTKLFVLALCFPVTLFAKSIEFKAKAHVEDCPPGYHYPVMECVDHETDMGPQHLDMQDAGDGFWIATFEAAATGVLTSTNQIGFLLFPHTDGTVYLQMMMSAGFDPAHERNPASFFEAKPTQFPQWLLVTGEHRLLPNGREALAELEYSDFKFTP